VKKQMATDNKAFWTTIVFLFLIPLVFVIFGYLFANLTYETMAGGIVGGAIGASYGIGMERLLKMKKKK